MGALTLKSFPFVLRSWDVKNFDSFDPTDSFGQDTKVYINKNKVIKIEHQFVNNENNLWLTDKGRQFFDSLFTEINSDTALHEFYYKTNKQWELLFFSVKKTFYIFDICNFKNINKFYHIVVFENLNVESLSLLVLFSQVHPYLKVKRAENLKFNLDLETKFQINSATSTSKLRFSSLCLLVGINTRYEGSLLNLKLRQRYLKGNFKCFSLGSFLNLTFPVSFLGSNILTLKMILEGNHIVCKDIVSSSNPFFVTNAEILKNNSFAEFFNTLKHTNILNKIWNGYNVLNSSISETGVQYLGQFSFFLYKDLLSFSSFYIMNVNVKNVANFKKVLESRIISHKALKKLESQKLLINQNLNSDLSKITNSNFLYFPNHLFFDNQETFINTEGLVKRSTGFLSRKNLKTDWQLLRKIVSAWSYISSLNNLKINVVVYFKSNTLFDFKNFISFQFHASKILTSANFYFMDKAHKFSIYKNFCKFSISKIKLVNTKLKYWLDDFYTGTKDKFCHNSLTLVRCSLLHKIQSDNFFTSNS